MNKTPISDIRTVIEDHIILANLFPFSMWENAEHIPAIYDVKCEMPTCISVNVVTRMSK